MIEAIFGILTVLGLIWGIWWLGMGLIWAVEWLKQILLRPFSYQKRGKVSLRAGLKET